MTHVLLVGPATDNHEATSAAMGSLLHDMSILGFRTDVFLTRLGPPPTTETPTRSVAPPNRTREIRSYPETQWPLINDWPWQRIVHPQRWTDRQRAGDFDVFPEVDTGGLLPRTLKALEDLQESEAVDGIVAIGPPYITYEAASEFHMSARCPFWLLDTESFLFSPRSGSRRPLFERRLPRLRTYLSTCMSYWVTSAIHVAQLTSLSIDDRAKIRLLPASDSERGAPSELSREIAAALGCGTR